MSVWLKALVILTTRAHKHKKHTTSSPEAVQHAPRHRQPGAIFRPASLSLARKQPADVSEVDGVASWPQDSQQKKKKTTLSLSHSSWQRAATSAICTTAADKHWDSIEHALSSAPCGRSASPVCTGWFCATVSNVFAASAGISIKAQRTDSLKSRWFCPRRLIYTRFSNTWLCFFGPQNTEAPPSDGCGCTSSHCKSTFSDWECGYPRRGPPLPTAVSGGKRKTQRNCVLRQIKLVPLFSAVNKLSPRSKGCLEEEKGAGNKQKQVFTLRLKRRGCEEAQCGRCFSASINAVILEHWAAGGASTQNKTLFLGD